MKIGPARWPPALHPREEVFDHCPFSWTAATRRADAPCELSVITPPGSVVHVQMCAGVPQSRAPVSDPDVRAAIGQVTCQGLTHRLPDTLEVVSPVVAQKPVDDVTS
ncbi:hypothetical protein PXH67_40530 (plasmid) [Streptomyces sp. P8-A8]|uniref:hypothetical protein n=1 Tax=Streptomyces sp. P8-A8 TaxID=3029759 RepID=UPI0036DAFC46